MDFQFDATADGRRLKFLNVIDEHSRLCLAIRGGRRCKAKDVVAVLGELTSLYPAPAFIRSDNGPEFNCFAEAQGLRPGPEELVQGQHGRTALPSRSTKSWRTVDAGSTTHSGRTRPSRGVRPWRQLNRELPHDHTHPLS